MYTNRTPKRAKINAGIERKKEDFIGRVNPRRYPISAPPEMPTRYGSARMFCVTVCKSAPFIERVKPVKIQRRYLMALRVNISLSRVP